MSKRKHLKLQPFYTMAELQRLTGISRRRVDRLMLTAGIATRRVGGQRLVFVSTIEDKLPELWKSMVACERARVVAHMLEGFASKAK